MDNYHDLIKKIIPEGCIWDEGYENEFSIVNCPVKHIDKLIDYILLNKENKSKMANLVIEIANNAEIEDIIKYDNPILTTSPGREIKFRAWNSYNNTMIQPDNLELGLKNLNKYGKGYDNWKIYMQYTGMDDVNGIPIYEGDILESTLGAISYYVIWKHAAWLRKPINSNCAETSLYGAGNFQKVIGNIFQNKELLH